MEVIEMVVWRLIFGKGVVFRRLLKQMINTSPVTRKDVTYGYNREEKGRRS